MIDEKLPPHDIEAEEAVLGSLLIDGEAICKIASNLEPADFYREKNEWIYSACLSLYQENQPIDQVTVAHELANWNKLEAIGGGYLSHLVSDVPTSVHIEHYAKMVKGLALRRKLIGAASRIAGIGYDGGDDVLPKSFEVLLELSREATHDKLITPRDLAQYAYERYSVLRSLKDGAGLPFGFESLDKVGGLQNGELAIVAGETAMGKTTFLAQVANSLSRRGPVLCCSAEMGIDQICDRLIAQTIGKPIRVVSRGNYDEDLDGDIMGAAGKIGEGNVYHYVKGGMTPVDILAMGQRVQLQCGLAAIIVDYIQNLRDDRGGKGLYQTTTNIVKSLKEIAVNLDVPLIAASQLSRSMDGVEPTLHRLRDTGAIEESAQWVVFVHRKRQPNEEEKYKALLILAKHTQGGEYGEQELKFSPETQTYSEIAKSKKGE